MVATAVHYVPKTIILGPEIQNTTTNVMINDSNNRSESKSERYVLKVKKGKSLVMLKKIRNFEKEYGEPLLSIRKILNGMHEKTRETTFEKQNAVRITKSKVKKNLKSMPDWKGAGPGKIRRFWLISFTAIHEDLAIALNECIEVEGVSG